MTQFFEQLGLAEPLLEALAAENYTTPTPIQTKAIPQILEGRDILGIAQTGTGKTAAFALPIIDRLLADTRRAAPKGCRALVLSPTRELATQIADSFKTYGRFTRISVTTVFGGVGARAQVRALSRGVDVLVATPGRLLDHIQTGACDLSNTGILVLDEADQMLDLGFLKPIRTIAGRTSRARQSLFFSATFPKEIEMISRELLRDPVSVRVTPVSSTAKRVDQKVIHVDRAKKGRQLTELLDDHDMVRTLVFTRTKRGADNVTKFLTKSGLKASAIHGNKSQNQRERALDAFRVSKIHVLVATDIAARGIDIPDVTHVVNYDLPEVPESYVHRIGRTARAGRSGQAISLCDPSERKLLRDIERLTKQKIPSERDALEADGEDRPARPRRRGANGNSGDGRMNGAPARARDENGESDRPRRRRKSADGDGSRRGGETGERSRAGRAGKAANGRSAGGGQAANGRPGRTTSAKSKRNEGPGKRQSAERGHSGRGDAAPASRERANGRSHDVDSRRAGDAGQRSRGSGAGKASNGRSAGAGARKSNRNDGPGKRWNGEQDGSGRGDAASASKKRASGRSHDAPSNRGGGNGQRSHGAGAGQAANGRPGRSASTKSKRNDGSGKRRSAEQGRSGRPSTSSASKKRPTGRPHKPARQRHDERESV